MKKMEFLPLGSIVILHGTVKKLMIIQRAVQVEQNQEKKYFDYGAALYPEGLVENRVAYFNQPDIAKVIDVGYKDDDDDLMQEQINDVLVKLDDSGNPDPFAEVREDEEDGIKGE